MNGQIGGIAVAKEKIQEKKNKEKTIPLVPMKKEM